MSKTVRTIIAISGGAIVGAVSRFYSAEIAKALFGKSFAYYGTFFVNILGCFIIAWVITANEERFKHWAPEVRLAVATGFCGAFTTFSTYSLEIANFLKSGNIGLGLAYAIVSAVIGMVGIWLGVAAARLGAPETAEE